MPDTFPCPVCGEEVPDGARACPHCGADEQTGWNEEATHLDGLDLPDEEFNYDEFVKNEFGSPPAVKPRAVSWLWWTVGIIAVMAFLCLLWRGVRA